MTFTLANLVVPTSTNDQCPVLPNPTLEVPTHDAQCVHSPVFRGFIRLLPPLQPEAMGARGALPSPLVFRGVGMLFLCSTQKRMVPAIEPCILLALTIHAQIPALSVGF